MMKNTHVLIWRIGPYFPKISYISSAVILYGRFLTYKILFTSGGKRIYSVDKEGVFDKTKLDKMSLLNVKSQIKVVLNQAASELEPYVRGHLLPDRIHDVEQWHKFN